MSGGWFFAQVREWPCCSRTAAEVATRSPKRLDNSDVREAMAASVALARAGRWGAFMGVSGPLGCSLIHTYQNPPECNTPVWEEAGTPMHGLHACANVSLGRVWGILRWQSREGADHGQAGSSLLLRPLRLVDDAGRARLDRLQIG